MQLNYFPIIIEFDHYQIDTEPYTETRLSELRDQYNATHSFFRNADTIYISNKDSQDAAPIGTVVRKATYGDASITSSLIKHLFFRTFKENFPSHTPVDFYPFRFFSGQQKDDIIFNKLPENLQNRIAYKKLIEVQLRVTNINGKEQFGFTVNIRRNWVFELTCDELHNQGYDLRGIEVLHLETLPGLTNVLAPNEEFIGIIEEVKDGKASIESNVGIVEFPLTELCIRKTKFNIGNYLEFALNREKSDAILKIIEEKRSEIYNAKSLYNEIMKISKALFTSSGEPILFQNKEGFCFTISGTPLEVTNSVDLRAPNFIFDHASTQIQQNNPDLGLTNYGPYDSISFDTKSPDILCICHRENRGFFSGFLAGLKDGMPNSQWFKKGLLKKYELQDVQYSINEITQYSLDEYMKVIKNHEGSKPHLAIIEIPSEFRKLEDSQNPYYKVKAKLLSLEIPVQFITSEKTRNTSEYILNSIALQIYAKLGGTPWVLPSTRSVDHEIVIGIGHSWIRKNQFKGAEQNRVVGITTFLSSDGQYLLGDKVKDVAFEEYFSELLNSLNTSFDRLEKEQAWSEGETVRLIFHIFKPIKNTEFDVISQLIKDKSKYKIKFAFVTISKVHPHLLFDTNQRGISKYNRTEVKGEFIPNRTSNIFLDSATCLIQMLGANELKTSKHGMSSPIQIKIVTPRGNHVDSGLSDLLYYDLNYIVQQIYSFTYLSWRSFLPREEPATMLYSNLISKLLSKMRGVNGWDADNLNYGLKRKKWFL